METHVLDQRLASWGDGVRVSCVFQCNQTRIVKYSPPKSDAGLVEIANRSSEPHIHHPYMVTFFIQITFLSSSFYYANDFHWQVESWSTVPRHTSLQLMTREVFHVDTLMQSVVRLGGLYSNRLLFKKEILLNLIFFYYVFPFLIWGQYLLIWTSSCESTIRKSVLSSCSYLHSFVPAVQQYCIASRPVGLSTACTARACADTQVVQLPGWRQNSVVCKLPYNNPSLFSLSFLSYDITWTKRVGFQCWSIWPTDSLCCCVCVCVGGCRVCVRVWLTWLGFFIELTTREDNVVIVRKKSKHSLLASIFVSLSEFF